MRGRYIPARAGLSVEDFVLDGDGDLSLAVARADGLSLRARLGADWRVAQVQASKSGGGIEASFRWEGDDWVGEILQGGGRREICLPMAGGLEVFVPAVAFEGSFLRRVGLPPDSQRRVETISMDPETLEPVQSHCIIERLGDSVCPWDAGGTPQARYRWTDDAGRQSFVWARADGVGLGRAELPEGPALYRFEEESAPSAPSSSAR